MNAETALIHDIKYFKNLETRTYAFINTLTLDQLLLAKKMKDEFDAFFKNVNGKLEDHEELWNCICDLKEAWDQFLINFEKIKHKIKPSAVTDKAIMELERHDMLTNYVLVPYFDLSNIMKNDSVKKFKSGICFALSKQSGEDRDAAPTLATKKNYLIKLLDKNDDGFFYPVSETDELPLMKHKSQLKRLWNVFEKNSIITESECLVNLTRDCETYRPMTLKFCDNFLALEIEKSPFENLRNILRIPRKYGLGSKSNSSSCISEFKKSSQREIARKVSDPLLVITRLSIEIPKEKQLEVHQCRVRDIKPNDQYTFKTYYTSQIHAIKHLNPVDKLGESRRYSYEPIGYCYAITKDERVEMCLNYKISGIKKIRMYSTSFKDSKDFEDISLEKYMEKSELKEKVKESENIIDKNLEKIFMEYKKIGKKELQILKENKSDSTFMIQALC
uniref:Uncharacterized protein n=1 Tax=Panagrolaimus sp. PS1159 TaxID=55785 RepID=A0AC35FDW7_9BILA